MPGNQTKAMCQQMPLLEGNCLKAIQGFFFDDAICLTRVYFTFFSLYLCAWLGMEVYATCKCEGKVRWRWSFEASECVARESEGEALRSTCECEGYEGEGEAAGISSILTTARILHCKSFVCKQHAPVLLLLIFQMKLVCGRGSIYRRRRFSLNFTSSVTT